MNGLSRNFGKKSKKASERVLFFFLCAILEKMAKGEGNYADYRRKKTGAIRHEPSCVAGDTDSKYRERNFCIITLFLNCGMRLSELCGISLSDIDRDLRSLRVVGKGNKERLVYLNEACREALAAYLVVRERDHENIKDKNALFLSRLGKRISNKTVQWVVYKYLDAAGLEYKHFSTHKLRHTAATLMYQEGGVDVLALKEILGHAQLSTTQIYTHVNNKQLEEAVSKNPLAKIRPADMKKAAEKVLNDDKGEEE